MATNTQNNRVLDFEHTLDTTMDAKAAAATDNILDSKIHQSMVDIFLSFNVPGQIEEVIDYLRNQCDIVCKEYAEKTVEMNNLIERLEAMEKLQYDASDFVINTSSEFRDLRSTVQRHDKDIKDLQSTTQKQDYAIKEINRKIDQQGGIVYDFGQGLLKVSTRSKENRAALLDTLCMLAGYSEDFRTKLDNSAPCYLITGPSKEAGAEAEAKTKS